MIRYHQLNSHEFEQSLKDSKGQGSLACCSPRGCRVGHDLVTEQPQATETLLVFFSLFSL